MGSDEECVSQLSENSEDQDKTDQAVQGSLPVNNGMSLAAGREQRQRRPPVRWAEESLTEAYAHVALAQDLEESTSYQDAIDSPHTTDWKKAMEEEITSLDTNETWILSTLPSGRVPIKSKWVYKIKYNVDGNVDRFKARLVAKGFSQREGLDYNETYSPVVRHESVRAIFALAAARGSEIVQLDVKTAFLNGELLEEIYMNQPEGFLAEGNENQVCRLNKCLYGLKQASRNWNKKFDGFLIKYGFTPSQTDPCVYQLEKGTTTTILAIWVDDGLLYSSEKNVLDDIIQYLGNELVITSKEVECFIGIEVKSNRQKQLIHLSQEQYLKRILRKLAWSPCGLVPLRTPLLAVFSGKH